MSCTEPHCEAKQHCLSNLSVLEGFSFNWRQPERLPLEIVSTRATAEVMQSLFLRLIEVQKQYLQHTVRVIESRASRASCSLNGILCQVSWRRIPRRFNALPISVHYRAAAPFVTHNI